MRLDLGAIRNEAATARLPLHHSQPRCGNRQDQRLRRIPTPARVAGSKLRAQLLVAGKDAQWRVALGPCFDRGGSRCFPAANFPLPATGLPVRFVDLSSRGTSIRGGGTTRVPRFGGSRRASLSAQPRVVWPRPASRRSGVPRRRVSIEKCTTIGTLRPVASCRLKRCRSAKLPTKCSIASDVDGRSARLSFATHGRTHRRISHRPAICR